MVNNKGRDESFKKNRLIDIEGELKYILYYEDYPVTPFGSIWNDTAAEKSKVYVVQTRTRITKKMYVDDN